MRDNGKSTSISAVKYPSFCQSFNNVCGSALTVMVQPSTLTVRVPMTHQQAAIGATVKR